MTKPVRTQYLNQGKENKDGKLRKKNQTEILKIKSPLKQIKIYSAKPLQQTRTSGR
jgi:hypothetical protein